MKVEEIKVFASDLGIKMISGSINLWNWKHHYLKSHDLNPSHYDMTMQVFPDKDDDVLIILRRNHD